MLYKLGNTFLKLFLTLNREERYEFIRAKYVEKKFASHTCADERDLLSDLEHAVNNKNLYHLLEVFAEGVDLSAPLPTSVSTVSYKVDIKYIYTHYIMTRVT
jgi:hypothetical protein